MLKRMLDHLKFDEASLDYGLPQPASNRGYRPEQFARPFLGEALLP